MFLYSLCDRTGSLIGQGYSRNRRSSGRTPPQHFSRHHRPQTGFERRGRPTMDGFRGGGEIFQVWGREMRLVD